MSDGAQLVLVRHGETTGESSIRFHGHNDVPLSPLGVVQMERVAAALAGCVFREAICSPLLRSVAALRIVQGDRTAATVCVESFREINFGTWEGLTQAEIKARTPELYRQWRERPGAFYFPGGESRMAFRDRVAAATREHLVADRLPVLAVLHKGVIKAVLSTLLNLPWERFAYRPYELGSITRLTHNGQYWRLLSENETAHLGEYRSEGS